MVRILRALIFIFIVALFSCEEQGLLINCSDCLPVEPVKGSLEVKLDLNHFGIETYINVYEGNLEDSILYVSYRTTATNTTIPVTLNKKYTVTATYYIPDTYYITVDSAIPRVKYEKDQCETPCYFIYNKVVDLRLKYTQ